MLQQLYLFAGLLIIYAVINVQPLSGRLAEFSALFNLIGKQPLLHRNCNVVPACRVWLGSMLDTAV